MKKIKETFNKHKTGSVVTIGVICLALVVGFTVGNYMPSEYTEASQKATAESSEQKDTDTKEKTKDEDKTTLAILFGSDKKSSSKSDSLSKSSSSKSGSSSSSSSSSSGSSNSSGSSSSKAETTCNHDWIYYKNNGLDICSKCGAERATQHQHTWITFYSCHGQESVLICHKCGTHYQGSGCPNCGSYSYSSGVDETCYAVMRYCTSCEYEEIIGYEYYSISEYTGSSHSMH